MRCPWCAQKRSSDGSARGSALSGGGKRAPGTAGRGSRKNFKTRSATCLRILGRKNWTVAIAIPVTQSNIEPVADLRLSKTGIWPKRRGDFRRNWLPVLQFGSLETAPMASKALGERELSQTRRDVPQTPDGLAGAAAQIERASAANSLLTGILTMTSSWRLARFECGSMEWQGACAVEL